jgi:hypothetical protein
MSGIMQAEMRHASTHSNSLEALLQRLGGEGTPHLLQAVFQPDRPCVSHPGSAPSRRGAALHCTPASRRVAGVQAEGRLRGEPAAGSAATEAGRKVLRSAPRAEP